MGRNFYVFLKLVNLILCVFLIIAWALFSPLGLDSFKDDTIIADPDLALMYQVGMLFLIIAVVPTVLAILLKERHNKLFFFALTLINIFLILVIALLFTYSVVHYEDF